MHVLNGSARRTKGKKPHVKTGKPIDRSRSRVGSQFTIDRFEVNMPVEIRPHREPGVVEETPTLGSMDYGVRMATGELRRVNWFLLEHA